MEFLENFSKQGGVDLLAIAQQLILLNQEYNDNCPDDGNDGRQPDPVPVPVLPPVREPFCLPTPIIITPPIAGGIMNQNYPVWTPPGWNPSPGLVGGLLMGAVLAGLLWAILPKPL